MALQLRHERLVGLVEAAARQDDRAVREFVHTCSPDITRYCERRGSADSEALANLVFAEFFAALPRLNFDADQQVWAFLYRVARNRLIDEFRKENQDSSREMMAGFDRHAHPDPADRIVDRHWLRGLVNNLSEDQQRVIELRFGEELSLAETAQRTGKSVGAVKALQHRAFAALATLVAVTGLLVAIGMTRAPDQGRVVSVPANGGPSSSSVEDEAPPTTTFDRSQDLLSSKTAAVVPIPSLEVDGPPVGEFGSSEETEVTRPADVLRTEGTVLIGPAPTATTTTSLPESSSDTGPVGAIAIGADGANGVNGINGTDGADGADAVSPATTVPSDSAEDVPLVVAGDTIPFSVANPVTVIDLDVLANDQGVDVTTVSLVGLPDVGTVVLFPVGMLDDHKPVIRYLPGITPATTTLAYRACSTAGECQTATVTLIYKPAG